MKEVIFSVYVKVRRGRQSKESRAVVLLGFEVSGNMNESRCEGVIRC